MEYGLKTLYNHIMHPVLLYGAESWTMGKKAERILEATEMRMLRKIKGITLKDKEKSENNRKELRVDDINEKMREIRMRWYGPVMRMEEANPVKNMIGRLKEQDHEGDPGRDGKIMLRRTWTICK